MLRACLILAAAAAAICLTFTFLAAQTPEKKPEVEVLSIELTCNGFPGTDQTKKTKQQVYVKDNMLFMEDTETKNIFIMRGDLKKAWEIDKKAKLYLKREFSYFETLKSGGNAGNVKTRAKDENKEINGFKCYPLEILVDGKVIVELWLARSVKAPETLMRFYRRFGGFPDKVAAELDKIEHFPVVMKANMQFGLLNRAVECEVSKVEKKKVPAGKFDLPKGLKPGLEAIYVEQVCNGFPGTNQKKDSKQEVIIHANKIFMKNSVSPHLCIVRGDKKLIWQIDSEGKLYNTLYFSYFNKKLKKEKIASRKTAVKQLNAMPAERRAVVAPKLGYVLGKNGKVPDKPVVKTVRNGEEKEINGFKCYHIEIYADKPVVFDLWLTRELKAPKSLIEFYETLGCFPDEVVAEIKKVKDFPISLVAKLDFGAFRREVNCRITRIERKKVAAAQFEFPAVFTEAKIYDEKGVKELLKGKCAICGKPVDLDAKTTGKYTHDDGSKYCFDCKYCKKLFMKALGQCKGNARRAIPLAKKWYAEKKYK